MTKKIGTVWVAPGEGATRRELLDAFLRSAFAGKIAPPFSFPSDIKTSLALTGRPIQLHDVERMEKVR